VGIDTEDTITDVDYCVRKCLNAKLWPDSKGGPGTGDSPRGRGGLSVGEKPGGGQREVWAKKSNQGPTDSKGESALQKLDRIARILDSINKNVDTVDDLVLHIMSQKKEEKLGTKKD
jgi:hypothetical protein